MAFGFNQSNRLTEGRWASDKTARPYESVAKNAWDHVCQVDTSRSLLQDKRLEFLEVLDIDSLRIQSLKGTLKHPTAYDKVAIKLNLGGYTIESASEIFGIDKRLVQW